MGLAFQGLCFSHGHGLMQEKTILGNVELSGHPKHAQKSQNLCQLIQTHTHTQAVTAHHTKSLRHKCYEITWTSRLILSPSPLAIRLINLITADAASGKSSSHQHSTPKLSSLAHG